MFIVFFLEQFFFIFGFGWGDDKQMIMMTVVMIILLRVGSDGMGDYFKIYSNEKKVETVF